MDDIDSTQTTVIDEGYHTAQMDKSHSIRTSVQPSQSSHTLGLSQQHSHDADPCSPTSSEGLERLGRGVKELVQGIQGLRLLGVEDFVLPLPKICVVGDQSTGKSSLIEAISEIKVPRSAGTCTRCPLEINLTESVDASAPWLCQIFLHKKYVYGENKSLAGSRSRPLGPWTPWQAEDFLFATLTSKEDVADALQAAQIATLNPQKPYEKYTPGARIPPSGTSGTKFSPNVVRLDISGPGLPNLSFYDLPGVINVAEIEEERYLVKLVKDLVKEYIQADNCINLLALAMTDDAANSSAMEIINEMNAHHRTLGVLTKPDRVQPGDSFDQWKLILNGEKYKVAHGYYVVKNPGQDSLNKGIDHAQARVEEAEFFKNTEPWKSELSMHSDRFGTARLQTALSQKLTHQILRSLPRIHDQVRRKAELVEVELASLPQPPLENLPMTLMQTLTTLEREVVQYLLGGYPHNHFHKAWNTLALQFWKVVAESRPALVVQEPSETPRRRAKQVVPDRSRRESTGTPTPVRMHSQTIELIDSDEESCKPVPVPSNRKRNYGEFQGDPLSTPRKELRLADMAPFANAKSLFRRFTLREVRDIVQDAQVAGIPNQVDPKAIERMTQMSVQHWNQPMNEFVRLTGEMLQELILGKVESVFGSWRQTPLVTEVTRIVKDYLSQTLSAQRDAAARAYRREVAKPMTFNAAGLDQARQEALKTIRAKRRDSRVKAFLDDQDRNSGRQSTEQERTKKAAAVTDAQLGADPYWQELDVMGTVRGYYDCASSRFVDTICMDIQVELFTHCRDNISRVLVEQLGLKEADVNERCARLMTEDGERERRRAQLVKEKEMLEKAQDWLNSLSDESPEAKEEADEEMYSA